jgi:hypothetical protein
MTQDPIKTLAEGVASLGEEFQGLYGEHQVVLALALALARTHPDPKRFAAEFRRVWILLGSRHQHAELGAHFLEGIHAVLDLIDELLDVPPQVRPPRDV